MVMRGQWIHLLSLRRPGVLHHLGASLELCHVFLGEKLRVGRKVLLLLLRGGRPTGIPV
jgi:hypothetical protein